MSDGQATFQEVIRKVRARDEQAAADLVKRYERAIRLPEEARWLADQRAAGRGWDDIAAEAGASPDTLRMRLKRALNDVAQTLGL